MCVYVLVCVWHVLLLISVSVCVMSINFMSKSVCVHVCVCCIHVFCAYDCHTTAYWTCSVQR